MCQGKEQGSRKQKSGADRAMMQKTAAAAAAAPQSKHAGVHAPVSGGACLHVNIERQEVECNCPTPYREKSSRMPITPTFTV